MKFLVFFVAAVSSMKLKQLGTPWLKDTLPTCPDDKNRTIMDDGKTHIVKYPYVGAVCQL